MTSKGDPLSNHVACELGLVTCTGGAASSPHYVAPLPLSLPLDQATIDKAGAEPHLALPAICRLEGRF